MTLPSLVLGDFDLSDGTTHGSEVMAEGTSRGAPVPLEVAVKSWLQDGSIVVTQGHDNREVSVRVKIRDADLTSLAETEAALFAELGKVNTLTWTPVDGAASVFNVITSSMVEAPGTDGDLAEAQDRPWRHYNLRLVCEPFVRSVSEVLTPALAASGTTTTSVDTGSSATGWTASGGGTAATPTVVSGAVTAVSAASVPAPTISLTRAGSITTSSTKYLVVDWRPSVSGTGVLFQLRAFGDGTELTRAGQVASPTAGYTRTYFYVAASSVASLRLDAEFRSGTGTYTFAVDKIDRSDVKPTLGTARQLLRSLDVAGSARTQGSLAVEHATSALGDVLVYTWPDDGFGYTPALRTLYRNSSASGPNTVDATLVSGSRDQGNLQLLVPCDKLPQGSYILMARLRSNTGSGTPVTYAIFAQARTALYVSGVFSSFLISNSVNASVSLTGTAWVNTALARFVLPGLDVGDPSKAVVQVDIVGTSALQIDEAWLFNTSIGQLTAVSCGTAAPSATGSSNRLFIEPATVLTPRPTVRRGYSADGSDAFYPSDAQSWMLHQFEPGIVNVFTVTSNATDASVSLRHYPRWHTHAAS